MLLLLLFVVVTFFLKLNIYFVLLQYCVANTLFMTNHIHVAMMWIQIVSKEKSKTKANTTWSLQCICFYHVDTCRYWSPCLNPKPKQSFFNSHTWILKQKKVQTFVIFPKPLCRPWRWQFVCSFPRLMLSPNFCFLFVCLQKAKVGSKR